MAERPTPLNAKPAPRITEVRRTVSGYNIYADAKLYEITGPGYANPLRSVAPEGQTHDPQTNFQRAVVRLKNEHRIPEDAAIPL